ncbi:peptidoglycan-binding domain-containing protein [Streptomyces sp. NPDC019396]|uniref:peptidoglycan-binding domain-containing protein n=1 Tax=Streptomyces sp. NPDC019396 TaxID=3154687 RepID=UPI0033D64FCC
MSLWTSLEPASTTVDPGSTATVRLRLRNTGDVVDEYRFSPVGDIAPYVSVSPPTLRIYPGTTGSVELTFAPPRTPDATAGPNPYGIQIIPSEHPEATTVSEGNLTVTPFTEVRAELVPRTVKGRFRGRPKLAIDNIGNTKLTASVNGSDNGDQLSYDIHPANVQIEPGRAVFIKATLRPRQITWFGREENRPFSLDVQRSGKEPMAVEGTYAQKGVLPRWLATFLTILLGLVIAFVALWFAFKPQVRSMATERLKEANAAALPPPPSTPVTPPSPSASPPAPDSKGAGQSKPGAGGGGGSEEESDGPHGPLPWRPGDGPNLYVQFAQARLSTFTDSNPCKLTAQYTLGKMDQPTVTALKCFQKANDKRYDGLTVDSDGLGNLGRSTMTALKFAHFGTDTSSVQPGQDNADVLWMTSAVLWADTEEFNDSNAFGVGLYTRSDSIYLLTPKYRSHAVAGQQLADLIGRYQRDVGLTVTGKANAETFAALHAGRVKNQYAPGTVTAKDFPPPPVPGG